MIFYILFFSVFEDVFAGNCEGKRQKRKEFEVFRKFLYKNFDKKKQSRSFNVS
jgi:hypothetical protein